jgi:hypothetical protein
MLSVLIIIALILYLNYELSSKVCFANFSFAGIFAVLCLISFIALLIVFPKASFESAASGIRLWGQIVVPSLFPF